MNKSEINKKILNTEYVYCLSNRSFNPNILKVGWTRHNPALRAGQLYTTGLHTPFKLEFVILTQQGKCLEGRIHQYLARCRVSGSREFFHISLTELREILTKKFSLTLVQLSEIIDHIPKEEHYYRRKTKTREIIPNDSLINSRDDTPLINSDEIKNMFAAFRYQPSPPNTPENGLNIFEKFKYRPSSS